MPTFNLRFVTEGDFVSDAIKFVEGGSEWSHVDIILSDGTYLGARANGGVQIRHADYLKNVTMERRYAIPVSEDVLDKIMDFAKGQIGKEYDFKDIIGLATHTKFNDLTKWICSEFVASAALAGGLQMLNVETDYTFKITPEMLHLSPLLIVRCVYKFKK